MNEHALSDRLACVGEQFPTKHVSPTSAPTMLIYLWH